MLWVRGGSGTDFSCWAMKAPRCVTHLKVGPGKPKRGLSALHKLANRAPSPRLREPASLPWCG